MEKNRIKNKASQGHVEIILSFTIFVGFLVVIFYFLSPVSNSKISYSSVDRLEQKLLENLSLPYEEVSVVIKDPDALGAEPCFSVDNSLNFSEPIVVKDGNQNIAAANISSSGQKITIENKGSAIYAIYSSSFANGFNSHSLGPSGCISLAESNYSFTSPIFKKLVLYENLEAMNDEYLSNYGRIKSELGLNNDFEFAVYNLTRSVLMNDTLSVHKLKFSSVLSRNIIVQSIDKNASLSGIIINLRVW